nr:ribonuclease H-like domain-containing protein [Tanacetum cinerariifolium]
MVSVDSMLNWNEHKAKNKPEEGEQVYGLMAGFKLDFADPAVNAACSVYDAAAEFAMMGISPKVQTCPFDCDSKLSELKKYYAHLETMYNDSFIQVQAYKNTVKTLELQKDWYHKTQFALEEKVMILSANLENTTNTLKYSKTLYNQAKIKKKEWEVKLVESLARFDKWKASSKNLAKLISSSMTTRTKLGLGFKEYFGLVEVFDLSTPTIFDPEPVTREVKSLYERNSGNLWFKSPTSSNTSESNDFVSCDNSDKSSESKTHEFASCVSSLTTTDSFSTVDVKILPKSGVTDLIPLNGVSSCSIKENVKPPSDLCNKRRIAASVPAGSRNSSASTTADRFIPAASRNRSASIYAGRSIPAASRNRPASIHAGRHIPADLTCNEVPRTMVDLSNLHGFSLNDPKGRLKSMTGNKEKLADFVQVKGGTVTFRGGDGSVGLFLGTKDETFNILKDFIALIENQLNKKVKAIRCDNGTEFWNAKLIALCGEKGIKKNYSNARTPQQNGVAKRTDDTNILAGTQADDSDSECNEHVILVPSFPSNSFLGPAVQDVCTPMKNNLDYTKELARLQRQEYEAHFAAAKHGFEFSVDTAALLPQANTKIHRNLVHAAGDPAGGIVPTGGVPAGSDPAGGIIPTGGDLAGSSVPTSDVPAGSIPARSVPAGGVLATESAASSVPAASVFVPAVVPTDSAANSLLLPVHSLGSYSNVAVDPVATKRVNFIHGVPCRSPNSVKVHLSAMFKIKIRLIMLIIYIVSLPVSSLNLNLATALADSDWVAAMQEEMQHIYHQQVWKLVPLPAGKIAIGTKWIFVEVLY